MKEGLSIAAYNACGAFSDENRAFVAAEGMKRGQYGLVIISEAAEYDQKGDTRIPEEVYSRLKNDYNVHLYDYDDFGDLHANNRPRNSFMLLSGVDVAIEPPTDPPTEIRRYIKTSVIDNEKDNLDVLGVHLCDRSEDNRLRMVEAITANSSLNSSTVVAGDFNALHGSDVRARLYRAKTSYYAALATPNQRIRNAGEKLHEMGYGTTMQRLKEAGLEDADPEHHSTMLLGGLAVLGQLDRIMYSRRDVETRDFQRFPLRNEYGQHISDHCLISATVRKSGD